MTEAQSAPRAQLGVFGGSGFYSFLDDVSTFELSTPYGAPSAPVAVGRIEDRSVAFIPRHGVDHQFVPHQVPARANLWAMHMLGVGRIVGPCAAGSLKPEFAPGDFVVCDQLVDRTRGRDDTFYDRGDAHHVSFADPYCDDLSAAAVTAGRSIGVTVHDGGTVVVVPGPRFSTRAESRWYRDQGWEVINMTQYPEAYLARELGMCYANISLITDYDTGVEGEPHVEPVTQEQVFQFFEDNVVRVRELLFELLPTVSLERDSCSCADARGPLPDFSA
ncbi:MAG: S-methyl-5'-thioadenosine phosphorylase [Acidimicrobiia bacterium]